MKLTLKEWTEKIAVEAKGGSRSRFYTATCPLCDFSHNVDILASDASARLLATQRVATHVHVAHRTEIAGDGANQGKTARL